MDDYETIDYKKHYEATVSHEERITQLERKVKAIENLVKLNNLI